MSPEKHQPRPPHEIVIPKVIDSSLIDSDSSTASSQSNGLPDSEKDTCSFSSDIPIDDMTWPSDDDTFCYLHDADLFTVCSEPLFPGSSLTSFQAVSLLMSWQSLHPGISKAAVDHLLKLLHDFILPAENNIPATYGEAHRVLNKYLTPVKQFDYCVNDCVIFRDTSSEKYSSLTKCPVCNEQRYESECHSIARKRFKYLPVETRLRRLFGNKKTSKLLQTHEQDTDDTNIVSSIHQSETWKKWYDGDGYYKGDPRAITFSICLDGMNPFKKENVSYSMCPILLSPLNFPDQLRVLAGSKFLVGIIPGPKEPKNTDPYIQVVVDELLQINGIEMYDAYQSETFKLQANILLHQFDYPGQNKVFHCQGI